MTMSFIHSQSSEETCLDEWGYVPRREFHCKQCPCFHDSGSKSRKIHPMLKMWHINLIFHF